MQVTSWICTYGPTNCVYMYYKACNTYAYVMFYSNEIISYWISTQSTERWSDNYNNLWQVEVVGEGKVVAPVVH